MTETPDGAAAPVAASIVTGVTWPRIRLALTILFAAILTLWLLELLVAVLTG